MAVVSLVARYCAYGCPWTLTCPAWTRADVHKRVSLVTPGASVDAIFNWFRKRLTTSVSNRKGGGGWVPERQFTGQEARSEHLLQLLAHQPPGGADFFLGDSRHPWLGDKCNQRKLVTHFSGGIPMTHENVWRAAAYMISEFGSDAAPQASRYAHKLMELGDPEGSSTWHEVARTIEGLRIPGTDELRN